jgi:hypothetical protein
MNHYKLGDKLKCIKETNAGYFEMCNGDFKISPGTIVEVTDLEDQEGSTSSWYFLEEVNKEFGINAWNDEDAPHIDERFIKIN